jgi:hypothetical protein
VSKDGPQLQNKKSMVRVSAAIQTENTLKNYLETLPGISDCLGDRFVLNHIKPMGIRRQSWFTASEEVSKILLGSGYRIGQRF